MNVSLTVLKIGREYQSEIMAGLGKNINPKSKLLWMYFLSDTFRTPPTVIIYSQHSNSFFCTNKQLMDPERCKNGEQITQYSVLEANQCFVNRILSRSSSGGRSSRFYHRNPGNVPFKWELRPGKPKDQPLDDDDDHIVQPSLGPPPVAVSKRLSRPRVESPRPIIWFWRKFIKKNLKSKKI